MSAFTKKDYTVRHNNGLPPVHPGEVLLEEFLKPLFSSNHTAVGVDVDRLALSTGIKAGHLRGMVFDHTRLTTEDAFRLSRYFGTTIDFWLALQQSYDVKTLERSAIFQDIKKIKPHPKMKGVLVAFEPTRPRHAKTK